MALHTLPGTTFSNPASRGDYDSDKAAALTLDELETWLWRYLACDYNQRVHSATGRTPLAAWRDRPEGKPWSPRQPSDPDPLAIEFLPAVSRLVGRQGIMLNGISYYEPFLATLFDTNARRVMVHYDPRDMSRVFLRGGDGFQTIRYRNLANPPLALWEIRAARKALAAEGRASVDEAALITARQANADLVAQGLCLTRRNRLQIGRRHRGYGQARVLANDAHVDTLGPVDESVSVNSADVGVIEQW